MALEPTPSDNPLLSLLVGQRGIEGVLRLHADALRAVGEGVAILDERENCVFLNQTYAGVHGYDDPAGLLGVNLRLLYAGAERQRLEEEILPACRRDGQWRGEAVGTRRDGGTFPQELALVLLEGGGLVAIVRDITERKQVEERMIALAYRDMLTGLPNRRLFGDRLSIALAQAHRYRHRLAVLFMDLDRFKHVNDTLGHVAGDELLQRVAERLSSQVREGDTVARLAGDEFTFLLPGLHYAEDVAKIAQKIHDAMRKPFRLRDQEIHVTASGGISLYPEDGHDAEALLKNADTAMYRAKERGRDNYQMYSSIMAAKGVNRGSLGDDLRAALDRGELELYYQPCLELVTRRIVAVEALLRWRHPEIGLIFPKDFIALADFTGQILAMGPWVLENACRQARAWQQLGARSLRVAVNLSTYELQQPSLVANVERAVRETGLPAQFLHLDVPEGYAMQNVERTIETLQALKAVGVGIAIDGFGVGFSSLALLRRLPIDALKMDLSFVRDTTTDPDDASLVTAVIAVAHSLKLKVIAQGVETEEQVSLLRALHCDEVQGYLWSPPVPAADCERLLIRVGVPAAAVLRRPAKRGKARAARGRGGA